MSTTGTLIRYIIIRQQTAFTVFEKYAISTTMTGFAYSTTTAAVMGFYIVKYPRVSCRQASEQRSVKKR